MRSSLAWGVMAYQRGVQAARAARGVPLLLSFEHKRLLVLAQPIIRSH